jgi:hypothetical protein
MLIWIQACATAALAKRRDERGLSQSTENALLVAGAVAVALLIVSVVTAYVTGKLQGLQ